MINKKSFLIACSIALMISLNNCVFLKSHEQVDIADMVVKCPAIVKETIEAMKPTLKASVKQTQKAEETKAAIEKPEEAPADEAETEVGKEADMTAPQVPKETGAEAKTAECAAETQASNFSNSLKDLQATLEKQISDLNQRQAQEQNEVNQIQAKESKDLMNIVNQKQAEVLGTADVKCATVAPANVAPETPAAPILTKITTPAAKVNVEINGCEVKHQNLIQVDGVDAIEDFGKVLNLKVAPPTISNSISTTTSIAKGKADDNSIANTVQSVKSTTTADAAGEQNSIAVSNVVGNSEAKTNNLAADNSKAVTAVDNANNATATANASENSLAASSVKADQKSETNTVAGNNSTAVGGTQMTTNAESTANATQGSIADTKAIADEKSLTNTGAANNSTAVGVTAVNTEVKSVADAANQSLAQSVAESANAAKTTTVALDNSAAVGVTAVNSTSNSTAKAADGGNALSTSAANSNVATESVANNNSASIVQNAGGSQSNATSVSNGIAAPYENPLQNKTGANGENATGINLKTGKNDSADQTDACAANGVKIPSILDTATKVTLKSEGHGNIMDNLMAEKDICGSMEDHKADILVAAGASTNLKSSDSEAQSKKEDSDKLRCEERTLREDNKRLKKEREDREDRDRAARKADLKRKRKAHKQRKSSSKRRKNRGCDSDSSDMSAPRVQAGSGRMYGDDCELNQQVDKDFKESLKEESKPDERFDEKNMFRDNIKEYDGRCNDERVNDDCADICKKEKLGAFVSSEIQDVMRGNFLFKCNCGDGISDWYMYDSKTDKSRPLSSTSRVLLDERADDGNICDDIPYPRREAIESGNATAPAASAPIAPILTAAQDNTVQEDEDEDELEDDHGDSRCGNFVSKRIDAARRHAKGGCDGKMHSDLGECFNNFISDKFNKLHKRLNKIKNKNTNYVKDLHKKQLRKQASKVEDIVDKSAENVSGPELAGANACEPLGGGDNLRNIQANMNDLKRDLKLSTTSRQETPEDKYFQARNCKDQERFDQRLESRFGDKNNCENNRFAGRFGNNDRYNARDGGVLAGAKKAASLKSDSGAFITDEVGKIKNQNKDYLSKIKNMFGGCE